MSDTTTAPVETTQAIEPAVSPTIDQQPSNAGTYIPGEQAPQQADTETRARAMGWVPKEQYRGNPEHWKEADEFVRRGEEILPIVQERNRDLTRRLSELEGRINQKDVDHQNSLRKLEGMTVVALQRQREQLLGSYDAAMRNAATLADVERYDQLSRDRDQAVGQFDRTVQERIAPQPQQNQPAPEVRDFMSRNGSWYAPNTALGFEAAAIHQQLLDEHPYMPLADNLARVEQTIKQRHPKKFGITTPAPQPTVSYGAVEGGGQRLPTSANRQRGASDLPADARAQAEKFVKQGLFKDVNEYARDYFAQS
jgi:hypothetical protein